MAKEPQSQSSTTSVHDVEHSDNNSIDSNTLEAAIVADGGLADPLAEMSEPTPYHSTSYANSLSRNPSLTPSAIETRRPSPNGTRDVKKSNNARDYNRDDNVGDYAATVDIEKGNSRTPSSRGTPAPAPASVDPNLVTWDGPNDPKNPKNWTFGKKWRITTTVSLFTFMSPVASSMLAPALPAICNDLGIQQGSVLEELILSIFVLAYAIGPLFLAPISEIMGRQPVLQLSNMFFLIFNIACSRAQTKTQMLVFRFLAGLGGSAPLAIGGGTISDLFPPEQRGLATSMYTLAPLTGPAIGPIAGAWIAQRTSWRWVFYSSTIADGIIQVAGFIFLRETFAPRLLADKAKRLRKETGNMKLYTVFDRPDRTLASIVGHGLLRPLRFLATEPIVQVCAAYMAVLYGLMYLTLATFATVWTEKYHMSVGVGGLNYLALGIGFTIGTQVGARLLDTIYMKLKKQNNGVATPEMRMPLMMLTSVFVPVGLLIFGWTADKHVFWLVPDIGIGIFAFGIIGGFLTISTYLIDNYTMYAASAIGAGASLRSLAGFGFPLFANPMFDKLGIGWGNSVLALTAIVFLPAPYMFYIYGPWLRSRSKFAKGQTAKAAETSTAPASPLTPSATDVTKDVSGQREKKDREKLR